MFQGGRSTQILVVRHPQHTVGTPSTPSAPPAHHWHPQHTTGTPSAPSQPLAPPCRQPSHATAAIYCTVLRSLVTILSARAERKQSLPHRSTDFKKENSPKSCLNRSVFLPAASAAPKQAVTVPCTWHLPVSLDLTRKIAVCLTKPAPMLLGDDLWCRR